MVTKKEGRGREITGFVLGIISVFMVPLLFFIILLTAILGPFIMGIIIGFIGLIFSILYYKKNKTKLSKWGLILNIIGIIIGIIGMIIYIYYIMPYLQNMVNNLQNIPTA